jgi:hypothetical protein
MVVKVTLIRSPLVGKKWRVLFEDGHHVDFGAKGYDDYTMHKDSDRMMLYVARHRARENWSNMYTAGFWARWLLWNKTSIRDSIENIRQRFNIKVQYSQSRLNL